MDVSEKTRPAYYKAGDCDVIRVIEEYGLGFHIGNALKYIVRDGAKGDQSGDRAQAAEYLRRWIAWGEREHGWSRQDMQGAGGEMWMTIEAVVDCFALYGWRAEAVGHLLRAAVDFDEDGHIKAALALVPAPALQDEVA